MKKTHALPSALCIAQFLTDFARFCVCWGNRRNNRPYSLSFRHVSWHCLISCSFSQVRMLPPMSLSRFIAKYFSSPVVKYGRGSNFSAWLMNFLAILSAQSFPCCSETAMRSYVENRYLVFFLCNCRSDEGLPGSALCLDTFPFRDQSFS